VLELNQALKFQSDLPALHYWLAQAHIQKGELQQAKQELETALQYDPRYETARLSLTKLDLATGAIDRALANSRRIIQNNPGEVEAALAYSQSLFQKGDYASARKTVDAVLKRNPDNFEAHSLSGVLDLNSKDLAGARQEFHQAWALQPQSKALLESVVMGFYASRRYDFRKAPAVGQGARSLSRRCGCRW